MATNLTAETIVLAYFLGNLLKQLAGATDTKTISVVRQRRQPYSNTEHVETIEETNKMIFAKKQSAEKILKLRLTRIVIPTINTNG